MRSVLASLAEGHGQETIRDAFPIVLPMSSVRACEQKTLAEFVDPVQPAANDSIDVRVSSGGLFVYGATANNRTNDPSLQVPRRQATF